MAAPDPLSVLPRIRDFAAEVADPDRYSPLGPDWAIANLDVIGSTKLAAAGRHRDVNFVGGAAVAVLAAVIGGEGAAAPCVQFAGDGALAAVPPGRRAAAEQALAALVHWSINDMGVPVRAGMVEVAELYAAGLEVRAALQELAPDNSFGVFFGNGVAVAESWIKNDPARQVAPEQGPLPGLEALSCRWFPVPAGRGVILSVIVDPVAPGLAGVAALMRFQGELEAIVPTRTAGPLGDGGRLVPRWPPSWQSLWLESRTVPRARRPGRVLWALAASFLVKLLHVTGRSLAGFDPRNYRRSLAERSDYRKAAGGPRFVLDVTEEEAAAIEAVLEARVADGTLRYGLARSDATTITCLVGDLATDRHLHFVDGAGIGLWRASMMLKERFGMATPADR